MSHSYGSSSGEALTAPLAPPESSAALPASTPQRVGGKRALLKQFIKFCVVGASSTVISLTVVYFCIKVLHLQQTLYQLCAGNPWLQTVVHENDVYIQVASTFGFIFGLMNSFFWNSRWTFPQSKGSLRRRQYFQFFAVNIVGLVLNWLVTFAFMQILKGGSNAPATELQRDIAIFGAIFVVSFWNFSANKFWTFKQPASARTS